MGKSSFISISPLILTYSVSVTALLEYMYIEINRGSSSFYCSYVASSEQWPSSQSLSYYVHVSAQFLQTNEMFAATAWLFALTRKDVGTTSSFIIFFCPSQINIKALFRIFCWFLKEQQSPCP